MSGCTPINQRPLWSELSQMLLALLLVVRRTQWSADQLGVHSTRCQSLGVPCLEHLLSPLHTFPCTGSNYGVQACAALVLTSLLAHPSPLVAMNHPCHNTRPMSMADARAKVARRLSPQSSLGASSGVSALRPHYSSNF
jgi:hypothetical protein